MDTETIISIITEYSNEEILFTGVFYISMEDNMRENQIKKSFVRIKHSVRLTLSPTARTDGFVKNNLFGCPYINQPARPIAGSSGGLQSNRACPDGFVPRAEARACPTRYIR